MMLEKYLQSLKITLNEQKTTLKKHLGLDLIFEEKKWCDRYALTSLIDCLPIAGVDQVHSIALRANPLLNSYEVVVTHFVHGESMVICSTLSNFVPIWIVTKLVNVDSTYWESWTSKEEEEWKALINLHHSLGAKDNLTALRDFTETEQFKSSFCNNLNGELWIKTLPEAFSKAAPYSARGEFQKVINTIGSTGWQVDLEISSYPEWYQPLSIITGLMGFPSDETQRKALLENAIKVPANHDSQWSYLNGVLEYAGSAGRKHGAPLLIAKAYLEQVSDAEDNIWKEAIKKMIEIGEKYDGSQHFELMDSLQKQGDYISAWNAALSFCFWRYQQKKKVDGEIQLLLWKFSKDFLSDNVWPILKRNMSYLNVK